MSPGFDRRDFLKLATAGTAAAALGSCTSSWKLPPDGGSGTSTSSLRPAMLVQVRGSRIQEDLSAALTRLLEPLGGLGAFVKRGQTVLLKPNMGFAVPNHRRANTSTELITGVARLALALGAARVIIADHSVSDSEEVIQIMGLRKAVEPLGVRVMAISDDSEFVETKLPRGRSIDSADILRVALEADVHIALPIVKSHGSAGFSGTLKGMMGLVRTRKTFHWLHDLHQAIVDLNTVIRPHLVIMDGLEVMSTDGPRGPGKLVRCDSLIAGTDPVAVDSAGARLAPLHGHRVPPARIRHLAIAASMGLGHIQLPADHVQLIDLAQS